MRREVRDARTAAGLSQREVARAAGIEHTSLGRFERGRGALSIPVIGAILAVLGLELSMRAYPAGDPIRDRVQLGLLERLRVRVHRALRWRTEVPLPEIGDLRAWDAVVSGSVPHAWRVRIEAETKLSDVQALTRKITLKIRDDPDGQVILLVSDTAGNRRALRAWRESLRDLFPLDTRQVLAALREGRQPAGNGIVVL